MDLGSDMARGGSRPLPGGVISPPKFRVERRVTVEGIRGPELCCAPGLFGGSHHPMSAEELPVVLFLNTLIEREMIGLLCW